MQYDKKLIKQAWKQIAYGTSVGNQARIADVGTGTGVWLRDVMQASPGSWTFTGFDISAKQLPDSRNERIDYQYLNILEDMPSQWRGQFDIVYPRLLIGGLRHSEWSIAAGNVMQLLKPGGWVQWLESDSTNTQVLQQEAGASRTACVALMTEVFRSLRSNQQYMPQDVEQLADCIEKAGFENVQEDVISSDRIAEMRSAITTVQHDAVVGLAKMLAANHKAAPFTSEWLDEKTALCQNELAEGRVYYRWNIHCVSGQKPLSWAQ